MMLSQTAPGFDSKTVLSISRKIDDLEERAPGKYSVEEAGLRKKLACAYRLVDMFGWSEGIYGHITAQTPDDCLLLNPFGILFHEVTASSLIKVTLDGTVVDHGSTNFGFNTRAYMLHSAIHESRTNTKASVHLHVPEVMALTATDLDYIPLFQENQFIGPASFHDFDGTLVDSSEKESIVKDLGNNNCMLLKNHGFVTLGGSIEDAFFRAWLLTYACKAQSHILAYPQSKWNKVSQEVVNKSYNVIKDGELVEGVQYDPGELNWQAWMRALDDMGLKTGYEYRTKLWRDREHR